MKTMRELVEQFNRKFKDDYYVATLDEINSRRGWYVVMITGPMGMTNPYYFTSCGEFREWMNGVVLD